MTALADTKGWIRRMTSVDWTYWMGTTCRIALPVMGTPAGSLPCRTGEGSLEISLMGMMR